MELLEVVICFDYIRKFLTHSEDDDFGFEKFELESGRTQEMATDCVPLIKAACLEQRSLEKKNIRIFKNNILIGFYVTMCYRICKYNVKGPGIT